jgi:hypothetical protein
MAESEASTTVSEREALAAVGRVLSAVTGSGFELQPILDRIATGAAALCRADVSFVFLREGDLFHFVAAFGGSPEHWDYERSHPEAPGNGSIVGCVALEGEPVQIADVASDATYRA